MAEFMRRSIRLALVIITAAYACADVYGQSFDWSFLTPDDSLQIYAVSINYPPPFERPYTLYGIYLGHGAVITAAHVVGRRALLINPRALIAGQDLSAKVVKQGSFEQTDLALLSVDEAHVPLKLGLRRNLPLCKMFPKAGTEVVAVYPERTARSHIVSPSLIRILAYRTKFNTLIRDVQVSGSGVFDAERRCLLGIMSASVPIYNTSRLNARAGYFVPAFKIADFIRP